MPSIPWSTLSAAIAPVPAWRFYVTLPTIPGLSVDGQVLSFLVQKFVGTHRGIDYEQQPFNAGARNFPVGFHTENISIQFIEDQEFSVISYLRGWLDLIVDANGNFGLPSKYKRSIQVDAMDEQGNVIGTFGWNNCSPMRPDAFDWDGTQTGYLTTGCAFVTDGAWDGASANAGGGGNGTGTGNGGITESDAAFDQQQDADQDSGITVDPSQSSVSFQ